MCSLFNLSHSAPLGSWPEVSRWGPQAKWGEQPCGQMGPAGSIDKPPDISVRDLGMLGGGMGGVVAVVQRIRRGVCELQLDTG